MQDPRESAKLLTFAAFEVNLRTGELRKGRRKIKLQEQPFQILTTLLERPGELVAREELRQRLWPGDTFVDFDHSLNTAVKKLRQALGDDTDKPHFIETLPRRGYRFIAAVDGSPGTAELNAVRPREGVTVEEEAEADRAPASKRWRSVPTVIGLVALALPFVILAWRYSPTARRQAIDSIAVLPFVNASADPNTEYLSDGITEGIISSLSQLPKLRVMARSTVFSYKGRADDPRKIGRELNVSAVLTGKISQRDNDLSMQVELVRVGDGSRLWGEQYNRKLSDALVIQEAIAAEVSQKLRVRLTGEERKRLTKRYTGNSEAYQLYLQGRYFFNKQTTPVTVKKGTEYFQKAIEKDPNYALAYAGLADGYAWLGLLGALPPKEAMPKAKAMAERALALDGNLAEAHTPLGVVLFYYDWDGSGAEREYQRAIQLNPDDSWAHFLYSWYLAAMTRLDEAIAEANRAQELEPLSLLANWNVANTWFLARQYDRALEQCRRVVEMDPSYERVHYLLGRIYEQKGLYQEARAEWQKRAQLSPHRLWDLEHLANTYAASGDRRKAKELLAQALKEKPIEGDIHAYMFAGVYVKLGERDQAFKWLEKSYEDRDWPLVQLNVAPQWDPLRSDPRFQNLVRRVGLPPVENSKPQKAEKQ